MSDKDTRLLEIVHASVSRVEDMLEKEDYDGPKDCKMVFGEDHDEVVELLDDNFKEIMGLKFKIVINTAFRVAIREIRELTSDLKNMNGDKK